MIKYLVRHNKPEILVITPLLTGHKVSKECKKTIKRNKTSFEWITYMGPDNPCKNAQLGLNEYKKNNDLPPYIIKIDDDLIAQRGMLDAMKLTLQLTSNPTVAYCYCGFEFKGFINWRVSTQLFDADKLRKNNYISSCSLMDTKKFMDVGQWVTDNRGFRLLDWALWLKFLNKGYVGLANSTTSFIAQSTQNSVSSRDMEDFKTKQEWVLKNFA